MSDALGQSPPWESFVPTSRIRMTSSTQDWFSRVHTDGGVYSDWFDVSHNGCDKFDSSRRFSSNSSAPGRHTA